MSFDAAEWHHGYAGCALFLLGWGLGVWWLWVPGVVLVADDAAQHFLGLNPSPIHQFYVRWLWPLHYHRRVVSADGVATYVSIYPVQRLNRWLDRLFA